MPYPTLVTYPSAQTFPGLQSTILAEADGSSSVTGDLGLIQSMTVSSAGTSSLVGRAGLPLSLAVSATGAGQLIPQVVTVFRSFTLLLGGAATATASLSLQLAPTFTAPVAGTSTVTGALRTSWRLAATSQGAAVVTARLPNVNMAATSAGSSAVTAQFPPAHAALLTALTAGVTSVLGWFSVPDFPISITSRPPNIADGLTILALHVGNLWDEMVATQGELKGVGTGGLTIDLRPTSPGNVVLTSRARAGDSQPRFALTASGRMQWGPGGSTAPDVTLDRTTTRTMQLSGSLIAASQNAIDVPLMARGASGQTADLFQAVDFTNTPLARVNISGQLQLTQQGSLAGVTLGGDAQLYRSGAGTLRVAAQLEHAGNVSLLGTTTITGRQYPDGTTGVLAYRQSGDSQDRFVARSDGSLLFGAGAVAPDVSLTRTATTTLQVGGQLTVTGGIASSGYLTVLGAAAFQGSATAQTVAADSSSTAVATTAFVLGQAADAGAVPLIDGTAVAGSSFRFARADHVHPTDSSRAPIISPVFTGTPTAPTAAVGTNTNQLATTAFVQNTAFNATQGNLSNAVPLIDGVGSGGTSGSGSRADHVHPTDTSRAPLVSPTFTGTPAAPTATVTTSTTQLATTAFVGAFYTAQAGVSPPGMDGAATVGTSPLFARQDHLHPTDTSRAGLTSPAFSGSPTAPTPPAGNNTTQVATTAFVQLTHSSFAGTAPPVMNGAALAGASLNFSREDHVHPSDSSRAPINSPTFTGTVTASTVNVTGTLTAATVTSTGALSGLSLTVTNMSMLNGGATVSGVQLNSTGGGAFTGTAQLTVLAQDLEVRKSSGQSRLILSRPDGTRRALRLDNADQLIVEVA